MNIRRLSPLVALPPAAADADAPCVLVVDDDTLVSTTVSMQLESEGWVVVVAADIATACQRLRADPAIMVVVCDIHLASESGFDLASALSDLRPEAQATEIIFITGDPTSDTAIEALRHRAFDLIRKPIRRAELRGRVAAAARSAERRRDHQTLLDELAHRLDQGEATKRRLAEALRQAEDRSRVLAASTGAMQQDLLAVIAHELKTPLIPIVGLSDIILSSSELSTSEIREFAAAIREGGERLGTIIDRTLAYFDAEHQQHQAESRLCPVSRLIEIALANLPQPEPGDRRRIDISCPEQLHVWGAPKLLARALGELVDNAVKASPASESVRIVVLETGPGQVALDIIDRGSGLPESVRNNLGVPFQQGNMSLTRRWPGVGIGLAQARKIARLNGGELEIAESSASAGTRMRLILPQSGPKDTAGRA